MTEPSTEFVAERLSALELGAWQALLHTYHQVMETLESELTAEQDLTLAQYDVLIRLARAMEGRLRMSELADRVLVSPSGTTRVVDSLVGKGHVERQHDAVDARVVLARLTRKGRAKAKRAAQTHLRGIREHFTGKLTEEQMRNVEGALQVICGPHVPH